MNVSAPLTRDSCCSQIDISVVSCDDFQCSDGLINLNSSANLALLQVSDLRDHPATEPSPKRAILIALFATVMNEHDILIKLLIGFGESFHESEVVSDP
jgi:hypothetical protein